MVRPRPARGGPGSGATILWLRLSGFAMAQKPTLPARSRRAGGALAVALEPDPERGRRGREAIARLHNLPQLWGRRGFWQIRLRWAVAPLMIAGVALGEALGFELRAGADPAHRARQPGLQRALRLDLPAAGRRPARRPIRGSSGVVVILEVLADYAAMLAARPPDRRRREPARPLPALPRHRSARCSSRRAPRTSSPAFAAAGLWALHGLDVTGWLPSHGLAFRGQPLAPARPSGARDDLPARAHRDALPDRDDGVAHHAAAARPRRRPRRAASPSWSTSTPGSTASTRWCARSARERHLAPMLETVVARARPVTDVPGGGGEAPLGGRQDAALRGGARDCPSELVDNDRHPRRPEPAQPAHPRRRDAGARPHRRRSRPAAPERARPARLPLGGAGAARASSRG